MSEATLAPAVQSRPWAALLAILGYAVLIGFTDNYVQVIAKDAGLWQFHATRTAMAVTLVLLVALPLRLRLRPKNPRAVMARSVIHGFAMVFYFGSLTFLPVAQVAAALFTAPIFVLITSRVAYGEPMSPLSLLAVAVGFAGVLFVLGPEGGEGIGLATILPVGAGALYAMGNIATQRWCPGESALTLTTGFFLAVGLLGVAGMCALALLDLPVPTGPEGFVLRGAVWPTREFLFWTFVQAVGSLVGVSMMVMGYQLAEATRVSVYEYLVLPAGAFWTWAIWGEVLPARAAIGIVLIVMAGLLIATRGKAQGR